MAKGDMKELKDKLRKANAQVAALQYELGVLREARDRALSERDRALEECKRLSEAKNVLEADVDMLRAEAVVLRAENVRFRLELAQTLAAIAEGSASLPPHVGAASDTVPVDIRQPKDTADAARP